MFERSTGKKLVSTLWLVPVVASLLAGCASQPIPGAPPLADKDAAIVAQNRAEMRTDKVLFINGEMNLSPTDPNYDIFWHEYYKYEAGLQKINDDRLQLIRDFAFNLEKMDDKIANNLSERGLDIQKRKLALLNKSWIGVRNATNPMIAARFLQLANRINLLMDVAIASKLPLIPQK
jgi:hypothetical protein